MFRFTAEGRIGRLERVTAKPSIARLSLAALRSFDRRAADWLACVSFDAALTERIMRDLAVGDRVTLEGRIEARQRQIGDRRITDHSFIITDFHSPLRPSVAGLRTPGDEPPANDDGRSCSGRVLEGDCVALMRGLPAGSADFILTDPPYLVRYRGRDGRAVANDDRDDWLRPAFAEMHRVLKADGFCVSFYGWTKADRFLAAWRAAGFRTVGHIVFRKRYASSARYLRYEHEQAYLLAKGDPPRPTAPIGDVIDFVYTGNRLHPTQKPVAALAPLVRAFSLPGDVVLDPFCGSGSTLVAARDLGRSFIGMEIDPAHCATARTRLRLGSDRLAA